MSCYFDSVSSFIHIDSFSLRQMICDYLESNYSVMEGMNTSTLLKSIDNDYIAKMRNNQTWAGGIEISATCNLFALKIIVNSFHNGQQRKYEFLPIYKRYRKIIYLNYNGEHYTPANS